MALENLCTVQVRHCAKSHKTHCKTANITTIDIRNTYLFIVVIVGFFWSKVARRFRLALQAAKPKAEEIASPSVGYVDTAKYYGNIQPRRPISNEVLTPSLMARPSLENIRLAHEAAVKATNSSRINSVEHNS